MERKRCRSITREKKSIFDSRREKGKEKSVQTNRGKNSLKMLQGMCGLSPKMLQAKSGLLPKTLDGSLVEEVCMESEEDVETTWRLASTSYKSLTRLDPRHYPLSPRMFA